jgi:periplasmic copper chaperone A
MKWSPVFYLFGLMVMLTAACQPDTEREEVEVQEDQTGIQVEDAWARPGSEGRISAAYFVINNYEEEADVLLSANSDVAQNVEVHESYEHEDGMIGMREVRDLEIPAQSTVRFEQGGLHIMLIQLTRQLRDGDTFELTLSFENHGEVSFDILVRL